MINNILNYIKKEFFLILYRFLVGYAFLNLSILLLTIDYGFNNLPEWFNVLCWHLWIEFFMGFLVIWLLILGGFLYAYSGFSKNKIAVILNDLMLNFFLFLFVISMYIGWKNDFYGNIYFIFFNNYCMFNSYSFFLKIWIIFFSFFTLLISKIFLKNSKYNLVEYSILIGFTSFLLVILISLIDLFAMFVVIESLFFLLMCLSALKFSNITVEASIKYFIQNVFISGLSLLGLLIIYFVCKSTNIFVIKAVLDFQIINGADFYTIFFLIIGLILFFLTFLFKVGLFPVHFYVPDLYEASAYPIIFFFSSVVKPIFLLYFLKFFEYFIFNFFYISMFLYFVSFSSILLGLLGALQQTNIKRFLGYTSINQMGFLLFCFICNPSNWSFILIYLFIYSLFQLPFFFIMSSVADLKQFSTLSNFSDFNKFAFFDFFKYIISISFFFISGLPPFLLFLYKYFLLIQVLSSGYFIAAVFVILMNVLSLIYYLKIIKTILFEENNNLGITKINYIESKNDAYLFNEKTVLLEFSFYLFIISFFSIFLFIYFNDVEIFITKYSKNFFLSPYFF
jgi:NADH-quinone oxidoreductase subunit N